MTPRKAAANINGDVPRVEKPVPVPAFGWAANPHKLRSATTHIDVTQPNLEPKDREAAIKARYQEIKGIIVGEEPQKKRASRGVVQNLADDDGSEEVDNDQ